VKRSDGLGPTIDELRPKWIKMREDARVDGKPECRPATIAGYKWHMGTICKKYGDTRVGSIDETVAREIVKFLKADYAPNSCWNHYSTIRLLVDDAMAEKWVVLAANPFAHPTVLREMPARRVLTGKRPLFIELEHMQRVIACPDVPDIWRARHLVEVCQGLTEGELAGRVWSERTRGARPTLRVVTSLATQGPQGWATLGDVKNEYRERTLPVHSAAHEALEWLWTVGWEQYVGRPPTVTDPIFPGPSGDFSRPHAAEHLRQHLRAAGCPDTCNGHPVDARALRRCFSTWLDIAGVPEEVRGRLMGHAPKSVTAKHYTAEQVETDRAAIEKIALRWGAPSLVSGLVADVVSEPPKSRVTIGATFEIRTRDLRFTKPLLYR
jgi:hypothetical protein